MSANIRSEWDHWLRDAGELAPSTQIKIFNVPSGLDYKERCRQMQAALDAAYPGRGLEAYWHGVYAVWRNKT